MKRFLASGLLFLWASTGLAQTPAPPPVSPAVPAVTPPANPADVKQVNVSVKIVEFQTGMTEETGLSAYFQQATRLKPFTNVRVGKGNVQSADVTFPTGSQSAITVFLDQIHMAEGAMEVVLQALKDEDRAFILSEPKAVVTVASPVPTMISTTQKVPYENTVVVGSTAVQTTAFRDTGVTLSVQAPEIVDDDANPATTNDIYIKLLVSAAVNEEGQRITIGLDDRIQSGGLLGGVSQSAIKVPEFVSRSVATSVWVRHGQVLLLGGLYRNTKNKNLSTLPWLSQGEDALMGALGNVLPTAGLGSPLSGTLGNRAISEGRRELVFVIKAELWKSAYTVAGDMLPEEPAKPDPAKPSLSGVIQGISDIPKDIVEGMKAESPKKEKKESIESNLGGGK